MYQPRIYRDEINTSRFQYFRVEEYESDILVGISDVHNVEMARQLSLFFVKEARAIISAYGALNPTFLTSHKPVKSNSIAHPLVSQMISAGEKANVGPMAAVAGSVSEYTGKKLLKYFPDAEIIIENGGDIWASFQEKLCIKVYAGEKVNDIYPVLLIPARFSPCGICSSSAVFGHSFSYGKADCVTVLCHDAALADAYATSLCNIIQCESDFDRVACFVEQDPLILGCFALFNGQILLYGDIQCIQNKTYEKTTY
jgi:uncharacterized protein